LRTRLHWCECRGQYDGGDNAAKRTKDAGRASGAAPLPLSGTLKVLKRDLRAPYWEDKERSVH
jgi:hypothetical protein